MSKHKMVNGKFPKRLKRGVLSEDGIPHVKMEKNNFNYRGSCL